LDGLHHPTSVGAAAEAITRPYLFEKSFGIAAACICLFNLSKSNVGGF
jgi:hypothetical protein